MFCTDACQSDVIIPQFGDICNVTPRNVCPSKLVLLRCDFTIPTGSQTAIAAALATNLQNGIIGVTGKLKDFIWADPTVASASYADCDAPSEEVIGRDLSFSDYNAVDLNPEGAPQPFYDRTFWKTINNNSIWNFGYTDCDGNLYLLQRAPGVFSNGKLSIFQTEDRSQANKCIEVKKGKVSFLGDPRKDFPIPFLNIPSVLSTSPELAILY